MMNNFFNQHNGLGLGPTWDGIRELQIKSTIPYYGMATVNGHSALYLHLHAEYSVSMSWNGFELDSTTEVSFSPVSVLRNLYDEGVEIYNFSQPPIELSFGQGTLVNATNGSATFDYDPVSHVLIMDWWWEDPHYPVAITDNSAEASIDYINNANQLFEVYKYGEYDFKVMDSTSFDFFDATTYYTTFTV